MTEEKFWEKLEKTKESIGNSFNVRIKPFEGDNTTTTTADLYGFDDTSKYYIDVWDIHNRIEYYKGEFHVQDDLDGNKIIRCTFNPGMFAHILDIRIEDIELIEPLVSK